VSLEPAEALALATFANATEATDRAMRTGTRTGVAAYSPGGCLHGYDEVAAGWKCAWGYGISECSMLFLPRGQGLGQRTNAAVEWAERTVRERDGHIVRYDATNPAGVDRDNLLIRLMPARQGQHSVPPQLVTPELSFWSWIHRGAVRRLGVGSDARGFWVDRYSFFAMYNRARGRKTDSGFAVNHVRMVVQNLSNATAMPVELFLHGLEPQRWEKNWSPFLHHGKVYFSYRPQPAHIVLSCNLESGNCTKAYEPERCMHSHRLPSPC